MSEQFPMFRLATLLARQLSSPIAARIKRYATSHPRVRRAVIARVGRAYAACELRYKMWLLRLGRPARAPQLADSDAVQIGADIIGEIVIFSLGAMIITFEVNRQAMKQEGKVLAEQSQWVAIQTGLEELQREVALQQQDLERLHAALLELAPGSLAPLTPPLSPPVTHAPDTPPAPRSEVNMSTCATEVDSQRQMTVSTLPII